MPINKKKKKSGARRDLNSPIIKIRWKYVQPNGKFCKCILVSKLELPTHALTLFQDCHVCQLAPRMCNSFKVPMLSNIMCIKSTLLWHSNQRLKWFFSDECSALIQKEFCLRLWFECLNDVRTLDVLMHKKWIILFYNSMCEVLTLHTENSA